MQFGILNISTMQDHEHNEDDVTIESDGDTGADGFGRSKKEQTLKKQLQETEMKAAEHLEGWQRAKADLINAKREFETRQQQIITHANAALIESLLPVLDSFNMAMANTDVWNAVDENWRKGMEHTHNQLSKVLVERGLVEINPVGETFNPNEHEPIENVAVDSAEGDNVVQAVVQKGYRLGDKLLRPARVTVGTYQS